MAPVLQLYILPVRTRTRAILGWRKGPPLANKSTRGAVLVLGVVIGRTSRTMVLSNAKFSVHVVLEYGRKGTKFRYYIYTIKSECGDRAATCN